MLSRLREGLQTEDSTFVCPSLVKRLLRDMPHLLECDPRITYFFYILEADNKVLKNVFILQIPNFNYC